MNKNEIEDVLFTIKELDVTKTKDGNINLKIKITEEIERFFTSKSEKRSIVINKNNFNLTEREKEVLALLSKGKNNSEIAKDLCVSIHTAKAHVANILHKLSVSDRVQAVIKALSEKLIDK